VSQQASSDDKSPASPDPLERANDRIRNAAKWLIASSAAVGAALIAGSQLSSIGKLDLGLPTSIETARLWVAVAGAIVGLAGVVYAVWTAVQLLLPKTVLIADLAKGWEGKDSSLAPVVEFLKEHEKYLQSFDSPSAIIDERSRLIDERRRIAEEGTDDAEYRAPEELVATIDDLEAQITDVDARIKAIEDVAANRALQADFQATLRRLLLASIVVALGIMSFAWAANPPIEAEPSADLRNSRLLNAYLRDADLRNAKLDNADFTGADLTGADLSGASVAGVVWRHTVCPDGTNSDSNGNTCEGHLS